MSIHEPQVHNYEPQRHPIAIATLKKGRQGYHWIVRRCPLCGKRHTHGGGRLGGNPRELLGHRASHCLQRIPGDHGYILIETDEAKR